jgi:hypothetical protein
MVAPLLFVFLRWLRILKLNSFHATTFTPFRRYA